VDILDASHNESKIIPFFRIRVQQLSSNDGKLLQYVNCLSLNRDVINERVRYQL